MNNLVLSAGIGFQIKNMNCENKAYFCFGIETPDLTETNLLDLKPYTSIYLQQLRKLSDSFFSPVQFPYTCIPAVNIKLIQFV